MPRSAARITPGNESSAPVNAPRRWPNNWLSTSSRGMAEQLNATNGPLRDEAAVVDQPRHDFLAGAGLTRNQDRQRRRGQALGDAHELHHPRRSEDRVLAVVDDARPEVEVFVLGLGVGRAIDGGLQDVGQALEQRNFFDRLHAAHAHGHAPIGPAQPDRDRAIGPGVPRRRRLGLVRLARFAVNVDPVGQGRAAEDVGGPVREEVDGVTGAEDRRDVAEQQRGVGEVADARRHGDGLRRAAHHVGAVAIDPPLVIAVADGAAAGERAVVVDGSEAHVATERRAQRLRGFEDDERVDGAAGARADCGRERGIGLRMAAEAGERPGLGAEE